jgi:hypothetical protein
MDTSTITRTELQEALCNMPAVDPEVEATMQYIQDCRWSYVEQHAADFKDNAPMHYQKAWVANYEVSDYLRHACPSALQPRIAFVRLNHGWQAKGAPAVEDATHEERTRILEGEAKHESEILVETFYDEEKRQEGPHFHFPTAAAEAVAGAGNSSGIGQVRAIVVDVDGHFAVAACCSDGKALFNTTDGCYVMNRGGATTVAAFSLLLQTEPEETGK